MFLATHWEPNIEIWQFLLYFFSLLAIENLQTHLNFEFLNFKFAFWRNFANKKMADLFLGAPSR